MFLLINLWYWTIKIYLLDHNKFQISIIRINKEDYNSSNSKEDLQDKDQDNNKWLIKYCLNWIITIGSPHNKEVNFYQEEIQDKDNNKYNNLNHKDD
jgi:hypothetical protein